jgi:hypothetical protein
MSGSFDLYKLLFLPLKEQLKGVKELIRGPFAVDFPAYTIPLYTLIPTAVLAAPAGPALNTSVRFCVKA